MTDETKQQDELVDPPSPPHNEGHEQQDEENPSTSTATTTQTIPPTEAPPVPANDIALHHTWTLWYDNPRLVPAGQDWKESLKICGTCRFTVI